VQGVARPRNRGLNPHSERSTRAMGATQPPNQWVQGLIFRVHEADHPFPSSTNFNPLNVKLNPICHLPTLVEAHRILHVGRIRVKNQRTPAATHTYVFMVFRETILLFNFSYYVCDCRSQWPRGLRRGSAAACLLILWVRILPGHGCLS
jgi:hypothetical protein